MYHQLNWFTVGIFLASLLAIAVVTNALEVSVKTMRVVELKMKADVLKEEQLKENIKFNSEDEH